MFSTKSVVLVAGLVIAGAAAAQSGPVIKIDGSSTVYPVTEAVAEEYQKLKKQAVKVTVGISGTGGGFKKFCRGEIDIGNASRPILTKEMEECRAAGVKYVELPVAFDALTVVTHPNNKFLTQITVDELKKLWEPGAQGKITRWNQVNPAWPDAPIKLFGAGSDSGTFDYFTEAIVGKAKSSRGDYTASEDDNVLVQGVSRDVNSLGYFGYAYYAENSKKIRAVPIVEKAGRPAVSPSMETVIAGTYQPLSRPIFIYVSLKSMDKPEIREFVDYYLKNSTKLIREVKYVPLTDADYKHAADNFAKRRTGTAFGGVAEVGVKVSDLLKRDPKE
ncbi:MAG: PstS family phosphate ABC transporter substrate-binding protein [Burkholderiales bacterium]